MFLRTILSVSAPLALCAPLVATGQTAQTTHEMHRLHGDPAAYITALEDPKRDAYQKPHEVMEALAVRDGEIIADIGAGSGYLSVRLAHYVGKTGRVYAVDISPDMIRHLHRSGKCDRQSDRANLRRVPRRGSEKEGYVASRPR